MYLSGLGFRMPDAVEMQASLCTSGGGIPQFWYGADFASGGHDPRSASYMGCDYPPRPEAPAYAPMAPITISVPTQVSTQVSPQISPVFVQQEHPTNSPVDTGIYHTPAEWQNIQDASQTPSRPPDWLTALMDALKPATPAQAPDPTIQYIPGGAPAAPDPTSQPVVSGMDNPMLLLAAAGLLAVVVFSKSHKRG